MCFNNGRWLCIVYKDSAFFRGIMGHFIVPSTTRLQRYLQYSIFLSLVSCFTSSSASFVENLPNELTSCL
jgi:hypothetical protein